MIVNTDEQNEEWLRYREHDITEEEIQAYLHLIEKYTKQNYTLTEARVTAWKSTF